MYGTFLRDDLMPREEHNKEGINFTEVRKAALEYAIKCHGDSTHSPEIIMGTAKTFVDWITAGKTEEEILSLESKIHDDIKQSIIADMDSWITRYLNSFIENYLNNRLAEYYGKIGMGATAELQEWVKGNVEKNIDKIARESCEQYFNENNNKVVDDGLTVCENDLAGKSPEKKTRKTTTKKKETKKK